MAFFISGFVYCSEPQKHTGYFRPIMKLFLKYGAYLLPRMKNSCLLFLQLAFLSLGPQFSAPLFIFFFAE
jgi:hypothetical protein